MLIPIKSFFKTIVKLLTKMIFSSFLWFLSDSDDIWLLNWKLIHFTLYLLVIKQNDTFSVLPVCNTKTKTKKVTVMTDISYSRISSEMDRSTSVSIKHVPQLGLLPSLTHFLLSYKDKQTF